MLLEILTRHYIRRPTLLQRCQASLFRQTCDDWQQTLLIDRHGGGVEWANHQLARYALQLEGDYIWVLDDDDQCVCDTLVADCKAIVAEHGPDVIMAKMEHAHHGILPEPQYWRKPPVFGHVDFSGFVLRREVWQRHATACKVPRGADYQLIREVHEAGVYTIYWHDCIWVHVDQQRRGAPE